MTKLYAVSNNLKVFPTTTRPEKDQQARQPTEYNLTNLINRLTGSAAFVITDTLSTSSPIEFNIMGYYFRLSVLPSDLLEKSTKIYAYIIISESGGWQSLQNTQGSGVAEDTAKGYTGLTLTDEEPSSSQAGLHSLLLCEKINGSWVIPNESKIWIGSIDNGELK